jgi:glutamate dehydrogenase
VVLIDSCSLDSPAYRELVMRKSVKAFTDSMLDLIVSTPTTAAGVVDYLGKQELVYLGPDEQVGGIEEERKRIERKEHKR